MKWNHTFSNQSSCLQKWLLYLHFSRYCWRICILHRHSVVTINAYFLKTSSNTVFNILKTGMCFWYLVYFVAKSNLQQLKRCGIGVTQLLPLYGKCSNNECQFYIHLYLMLYLIHCQSREDRNSVFRCCFIYRRWPLKEASKSDFATDITRCFWLKNLSFHSGHVLHYFDTLGNLGFKWVTVGSFAQVLGHC